MNRILALQGLTGSSLGSFALAGSGESNNCSSSTSQCSTQSVGCKATNLYAVAW
ncbi:MAG: hypothetical protein WAM82_16640 [Thermoanaerobaculia bacterium]